MLTLDQKLRWSARQLLSHPWITAGDDELAKHDLTGSIAEMKRYNARRRLRAAANTVIMTNRISRLTNFGSKRTEIPEGGAEISTKSEPDSSNLPAGETIAAGVVREGSQLGDPGYKPPSSVPYKGVANTVAETVAA